ncbi:hypothetical protein B0H14DRAFT_2582034 [Mycena olivaceomarginata]|nr:hypothetical protein B0H14DRAFT_2582034 [Mycena olivaceomarginata]
MAASMADCKVATEAATRWWAEAALGKCGGGAHAPGARPSGCTSARLGLYSRAQTSPHARTPSPPLSRRAPRSHPRMCPRVTGNGEQATQVHSGGGAQRVNGRAALPERELIVWGWPGGGRARTLQHALEWPGRYRRKRVALGNGHAVAGSADGGPAGGRTAMLPWLRL